jgi:hypothetical protein
VTEANYSFTSKVNGDLFTVRGATIEEFTANLIAAADPGMRPLLEAVQGNPTQAAASAAPPSHAATPAASHPGSDAPAQYTCPHGERVYKDGKRANGGRWEAYFCPERGTGCKPMNLDGTLWK